MLHYTTYALAKSYFLCVLWILNHPGSGKVFVFYLNEVYHFPPKIPEEFLTVKIIPYDLNIGFGFEKFPLFQRFFQRFATTG